MKVTTMSEQLHEACERTVEWLVKRLRSTARGEATLASDVEPFGRFWLGRLTSEATVLNSPFGDRSSECNHVPSVCEFAPRITALGGFRLESAVAPGGARESAASRGGIRSVH